MLYELRARNRRWSASRAVDLGYEPDLDGLLHDLDCSIDPGHFKEEAAP
jgi:hypothetical protein